MKTIPRATTPVDLIWCEEARLHVSSLEQVKEIHSDPETTGGSSEETRAQSCPSSPHLSRVGYKEKFRLRVKTVLKVKDHDSQPIIARPPGELSVRSPNKKIFAQRSILLLCLGVIWPLIWVGWVCSSPDRRFSVYGDSSLWVWVLLTMAIAGYPTLMLLRRLPERRYSQCILMLASNVTFGYVLGGLSHSMGWEAITISLLTLLGGLAGAYAHCLTQGHYSWHKAFYSSLCGSTAVSLCAYYLSPNQGVVTGVCWVVNGLVSLALARRIEVHRLPLKLRMKHSLYFALLLSFEMFRLSIQATVLLLHILRRKNDDNDIIKCTTDGEMRITTQETEPRLRTFNLGGSIRSP